MTSEPKEPTEEYVRSTGMKHAYAYDKGQKLSRYFGVRGIPFAVLLDPSGTVVWSGHPAGLDEKIVESALAGALTKPVWSWPAETKAVQERLALRAYAQALEQAKQHDGPYAELVQGLVSARRDEVLRAYEAGDYLRASRMAAPAARELTGLPESDELNEVVRKLSGDEAAQRVIAGQEELARIRARVATVRLVSDAKKLLQELETLRDGHPETLVAREAQVEIEGLRARMP